MHRGSVIKQRQPLAGVYVAPAVNFGAEQISRIARVDVAIFVHADQTAFYQRGIEHVYSSNDAAGMVAAAVGDKCANIGPPAEYIERHKQRPTGLKRPDVWVPVFAFVKQRTSVAGAEQLSACRTDVPLHVARIPLVKMGLKPRWKAREIERPLKL